MTKEQRPTREQDPRVRRSLATAVVCSALLVGGALALVGPRLEQVQLGYRIDRLRGARAHAEEVLRRLEVEVATLRAPGRVESRARQLGMTAPSRQQVRLAREFVAGATGVAAPTTGPTAGQRQIASVSGHLGPDPASRSPLP